ncbi:MAG: serpin B [Arenicella sp.]|jgi:serpin B
MKFISLLIALTLLTTFSLSQNKFTFDFYNTLNKEKNVLFSPTSIKTAFAMAYEGANGATQAEFEKVFGFKEKNSAFLKEIESLMENADINNSIWILEKFGILKSYTDKIKGSFNADLYYTEFFKDPEGSAEKMNAWIFASTNGMITEMVSAPDVKKFKMAIVNAIYFKKNWKNTFDKKLTQKDDFKNLDGGKTEVDMMHSLSYYRAAQGQNEKIIELEYEGDKTSMIVILPNKMEGYELTNEVYENLNSTLYQQKVNFDFPRFTYETPTFELAPNLLKLGLQLAFLDVADFSGMRTERDLKIGTALHKAKIIVNEEGTEAAAATIIGMVKTTSVGSPPPILQFKVNKPFFYFIKDKKTNAILFMGQMNEMN